MPQPYTRIEDGAKCEFLEDRRRPYGKVDYKYRLTGAHDGEPIAVWNRDPGCINVVIVSKDEGKTDPYGRQIERHTSVMHAYPKEKING